MSIIKLPDEGDTYTGTVCACDAVEGTYGPQVRFDFQEGETLYLPYDSANKQLLRAGFDGGSDGESGEPVAAFDVVVGEALTFARTHNPKKGGKPYWDISVANGIEKNAAKPSKRLPSPPAHPAPDAPPAHHTESGVPDSPEGPPAASAPTLGHQPDLSDGPVVDAAIALKRERLVSAYAWAYDTAFRVQTDAHAERGAPPPDAQTIQNGAATLLIAADKRGAI